jgi:hypothetical protein
MDFHDRLAGRPPAAASQGIQLRANQKLSGKKHGKPPGTAGAANHAWKIAGIADNSAFFS